MESQKGGERFSGKNSSFQSGRADRLPAEVASEPSHEGSVGLPSVVGEGHSGESPEDKGLGCVWQVGPGDPGERLERAGGEADGAGPCFQGAFWAVLSSSAFCPGQGRSVVREGCVLPNKKLHKNICLLGCKFLKAWL